MALPILAPSNGNEELPQVGNSSQVDEGRERWGDGEASTGGKSERVWVGDGEGSCV